MAGQMSLPSTKRTLDGDSPRPKQSSILSFFNSQKEKPSVSSDADLVSSGEARSVQLVPAAVAQNDVAEFSNAEWENDEPQPARTAPIMKKNRVEASFATKYVVDGTEVVAPRILLDLSDAISGADLDQSDPSAGRYPWLLELKDAMGRKKGDVEYDGRTLFIPDWQWSKFTPFEKQFWEIKSKLFDTVVFFKKGSFYELYENDADIGAKEFNLKMVERVNMRMVGVPEGTFDFWAAKFVAKGHRVAKVDQLENAVSKTMREKSEKGKAEKIIRRELASVLTCGTLVDGNHLKTANFNFCLSLKVSDAARISEYRIGAAFVDASSAKFFVVDFEDDCTLVTLETFLAQIVPKEVIFEKSPHTGPLVKLVKGHCPDASIVFQDPIKEFWDANKTAHELDVREYFGSEGCWPECLRTLHASRAASFSAFGSLISYLRTLKLDHELLSYCDVSVYEIMQAARALILDGHAVEHLSVCSQGADQKNTLLGIIDRCSTPFGHRMLRSWVLHPPSQTHDIALRQDAIACLLANPGAMTDIAKLLKTIPDVERLCTRIHAGKIALKSFVDVLNGFTIILKLKETLAGSVNLLASQVLRDICFGIPEFAAELDYFFSSFNVALAVRDGVVEMVPGSCPELDQAKAKVVDWEARFDAYLAGEEVRLKCRPLKYRDIGKEIYQIEVPVSVNLPGECMVMSKTKTARRYWTPELRRMVNEFLEAKESLSAMQGSAQSRLYQRFAASKGVWRQTATAVATLDCLLSLASFSKAMPEPKCLPVLSDATTQFSAKDLRHPIVACFAPDSFVANDVTLSSSSDGERVMILTGANMGGKSTLLRQVGLAAILAQLGCWVPAAELRMAPFDRIFTRLGANDNIIGGESTFKVELAETAKVLKHATSRSLVIMDELGRGTSTFDGITIAEAVLHYLINVTKACVLFSTHYNMLCDTFREHHNVGLYYMNCLVDDDRKLVTFLYKLARGVSPKSYGIHVAHMAGIPFEVIQEADVYSNAPRLEYAANCSQISAMTNLILSNFCSAQ